MRRLRCSQRRGCCGREEGSRVRTRDVQGGRGSCPWGGGRGLGVWGGCWGQVPGRVGNAGAGRWGQGREARGGSLQRRCCCSLCCLYSCRCRCCYCCRCCCCCCCHCSCCLRCCCCHCSWGENEGRNAGNEAAVQRHWQGVPEEEEAQRCGCVNLPRWHGAKARAGGYGGSGGGGQRAWRACGGAQGSVKASGGQGMGEGEEEAAAAAAARVGGCKGLLGLLRELG